MGGQARVAYFGDLGMFGQELGQCHGVVIARTYSQRQSLETAGKEKSGVRVQAATADDRRRAAD
jgi:hypothetical protein